MADDCFLVTGALGCLGAWTVRRLVSEGTRVVAFDAHDDRRRLRLLLDDAALSRVAWMRGDIADARQVDAALEDHGVTHVVHLAALLHPQFKADPRRGLQVNALGGVNVFEAAARSARVRKVVYASSIAVYGPRDGWAGPVRHGQAGTPDTLYGVYKQAEEAMARVYFQDRGLSSIGIRPATVFGAGRDSGLTAGPTLAIEAALRGEPYHIGYGGRSHLHYADDLAAILLACARSGFEGAEAFNVRGMTAEMDEIVETIAQAIPGARGLITSGGPELPLPHDYDDAALQGVLGRVPRTSLADAVRRTAEIFRAQAARPEALRA